MFAARAPTFSRLIETIDTLPHEFQLAKCIPNERQHYPPRDVANGLGFYASQPRK